MLLTDTSIRNTKPTDTILKLRDGGCQTVRRTGVGETCFALTYRSERLKIKLL